MHASALLLQLISLHAGSKETILNITKGLHPTLKNNSLIKFCHSYSLLLKIYTEQILKFMKLMYWIDLINKITKKT